MPKITRQGKVSILSISEFGCMPGTAYYLCWQIIGVALENIDVTFRGKRDILLHLRPEGKPKAKPTTINTGLKWKSFEQTGVTGFTRAMDGGAMVLICEANHRRLYFNPLFESGSRNFDRFGGWRKRA